MSQDFMLLFLLHDIAKARQLIQIISIAEKKQVTPDVIADHLVASESYWRHEQDILCDICRIMATRADDEANWPRLYQLKHGAANKALIFPNLFITVAPAEWKYPCHRGMFGGYQEQLSKQSGPLTLHIYNTMTTLLLQVLSNPAYCTHHYEHALRVEFQGRGTLHVHLAAWVELADERTIEGTSGQEHTSALVTELERLFGASVDVQLGSKGVLNYINGYTTKASDAMNFTMKEPSCTHDPLAPC